MNHVPIRPLRLPPIWLSAGLALAFAVATRNFATIDMDDFLLPWFAHIRASGPIGAFATPFSNYTPPYLYVLALGSPLAELLPAMGVIKLLSFAGHVALASAVRHLLLVLGHDDANRAAGLVLLAPSLLANPALFGQCDAFWAAMSIAALTAAIERRHSVMFAWCGAAVAFKLQAAFVGPFFLALALARHLPFRLWLVAPLAMAAAMAPAVIAGWPMADLPLIYLRQARWFDAVSLNAPNLWILIQALPGADRATLKAAAWVATSIAVAGYLVLSFARLRDATGVELVRAACLAALIVPGLLPHMHERYFFLSDVLVLALVVLRPAEWRIAVYAQLGSVLAIFAYLSGAEAFAMLGGLAMMVATWLTARPLFVGEEPMLREARTA